MNWIEKSKTHRFSSYLRPLILFRSSPLFQVMTLPNSQHTEIDNVQFVILVVELRDQTYIYIYIGLSYQFPINGGIKTSIYVETENFMNVGPSIDC